MENEIWKDVIGWDGYRISDFGNVESCRNSQGHTTQVWTSKKLSRCKDGYAIVSLCNNGKSKTFRVHRLVAIAFIENQCGKPEVAHNDGISTNNNIKNLRWATRQENASDCLKHWTTRKGSLCAKAKLTDNQVLYAISKHIPRVYTVKMIASDLGIHTAGLYSILCSKTRSNWRHLKPPSKS